MRISAAGTLFLLSVACSAQGKPASAEAPKSVTVPATIDHNRVIIHGEISLPDGAWERVHVWVDNGNPDLYVSRRLATLLALDVSCNDKECTAPPPTGITVGGMTISFAEVKQAHIPLKPVSAAAVLAAGVRADINLPSSVLRHYDVLFNFPARDFSIGAPGTIHFQGESTKALINVENGLIQVPTQIDNKKYNLALDIGSCINFLVEDLFDRLAAAHADWPQMTGAVGSANMWGAPDEATWKLMRLERLRYGSLFLTNVAVVALPKAIQDFFGKRAGVPTAGWLGTEALLNYRVGLDYAHSTVYFDLGRTFNFPDFDVVGLVLRPEDDGEFRVLGVADFKGKPSVPSGVENIEAGDHLVAVDNIPVRGVSMGQVWSMLGGTPGQERIVTVERGGKQFAVVARVSHFLAEAAEEKTSEKKKR